MTKYYNMKPCGFEKQLSRNQRRCRVVECSYSKAIKQGNLNTVKMRCKQLTFRRNCFPKGQKV